MRALVMAAILALVGSAGAASAQTFDTFKALCIDTHADETLAMGAAAAAGWSPYEGKDTPRNSPYFNLTSYAARQRDVDGGKQLFIVGQGDVPGFSGQGRQASNICIVADLGHPADAAAAVRAWVGSEPVGSFTLPGADAPAKMSMFMFTEKGGVRRPVEASSFKAGAGTAPVSIAMVMDLGGKGGLLMYALVQPPAGPAQ